MPIALLSRDESPFRVRRMPILMMRCRLRDDEAISPRPAPADKVTICTRSEYLATMAAGCRAFTRWPKVYFITVYFGAPEAADGRWHLFI